MRKNLLVLLGLLVFCAFAARSLRTGEEERIVLAREMTTALELLWNTRGHQVELDPVPGGLQARVRVSFPEKTTAQRKQWNFSLIHFVALRRSRFSLKVLEIADAVTGKPLEPASSRSATSDRPYAGGGNDLDRAEIVRREAQSWLDAQVGSNRALALVECVSTRIPSVSPGSTVHYNLTAYAPHPEKPGYTMETQTTLVVILDVRDPDVRAAVPRLRDYLRSPRFVLLP